jgi:phosphoglycolate phosphatase-like HAD superfamily hydrolase
MATAAVCWGYTNADALKAYGPTHTFESVSDIPAVVA